MIDVQEAGDSTIIVITLSDVASQASHVISLYKHCDRLPMLIPMLFAGLERITLNYNLGMRIRAAIRVPVINRIFHATADCTCERHGDGWLIEGGTVGHDNDMDIYGTMAVTPTGDEKCHILARLEVQRCPVPIEICRLISWFLNPLLKPLVEHALKFVL